MKSTLRLFLVTTCLMLAACTPSKYLVFENISGGPIKMDLYFAEANPAWKVDQKSVKTIELSNTAMDASIEFNFGSGNWTDADIDVITQGLIQIQIKSNSGDVAITKENMKKFFKSQVLPNEPNGIRVNLR